MRQSGALSKIDYYPFIIIALGDNGGSAQRKEALKSIYTLVYDKLNEIDLQQLISGDIRWKKNASWATDDLKNKGLMKKVVPHGIWALNENGWGEYHKLKKSNNFN